MKKLSATMFEKLTNTMAEQRSTSSNYKDILKTKEGNNYLVRLLPDFKDASKTMKHYFSHGWKSLATGQFVTCLCPTTNGDRCPICEERVRLYRGDAEDKANAKLLGRKEQWLINAYVVDDPTNKENNNTIKVIRYGKQLDKIIRDAIDGVDKDEFGARVFDLSKDGCNFRIMVEKNDGGYPTYVSSKFLRESEIKGMTEANMEKVYDEIKDLDALIDNKSAEKVQNMLDTHFFCEIKATANPTSKTVNVSDNTVEDLENIETESVDETSTLNDKDVQSKLDDLMKDL